MKINTLFLDVGGVLLTNGWDHDSRELASKEFKLNLPEMESRHRLNFDTFEIGKISLDEYLNRVVFYEKRSFTMSQFQEFMFNQSQPYPEMIDLMKALKDRYALNVAVVSNEGRELTEYRIRKFKLNSFVDFFISSCFVHLKKPDLDIYRMALDLSQSSTEDVLYIDDRQLFVQVASQVGIQGIQHTDFESTREKLRDKGLND